MPTSVAWNLKALFRNPENLGWAASNNQGAKVATGSVLVFLNCDTQPGFDWLAELMTAFEDDGVGMAGARLAYPDGRIQHSGIRIWRAGSSVGGENRHDEHPTEDVDGVTGACMAIRRSVFDEMGGFDEGFWNGYDDVDACLTVQSLGYKIRYVATSNVMHHESATGGERWTKAGENVARLHEKWAP